MFLRIMAIVLGVVGIAGLGLILLGTHRPAAVQEAAAAPPPAPVVKRSILVAARPQRAGNLMVAEDVTSTEVSAGSEPPGSISDSVATRTMLRGAMVRRSLATDEPILSGDVLNAGDRGFLAAVLGVGMRAVTVAVDAVSGTAGLIWPGDRVDLVLTQQIDDRERPADRRVFGETVLTNLRVIAVDQQLIQGGQSGQTPVNNANRTVTIEASLYDSQRIAVASRLGRISLVVRSAADDQALTGVAPSLVPPPIAWAGDVSPALRDHKTAQVGRSIHLYHGPGTVDEARY
jgi:pilus assembly protein CpaB